jgi:hypothetical protein
MAQVGDKFTEVDRNNLWKVDKVHPDGKVDMTNQHGCSIFKVDLNTRSYHMAYYGKKQFQPYNPTDRYIVESVNMDTEYVKTKGEAKEWADLLSAEGEPFTVTDRTNDKVVFAS